MAKLTASPRGSATNVRLFEFFAPLAGRFDPQGVLRPDWETMADKAAPLVALWRAGRIATPTMSFARLAEAKGDVFLLAGRWDHTCDYRSQIALASSYASHRLVILDDDHTFHRLIQSKLTPAVVRGALSGFGSSAYAEAVAALAPITWHE